MGDPLRGFDVPTPHRTIEASLPTGTQQARMAVLYGRLADRVSELDRPTIYAGDCVSIVGVLAGLERRGISPTLVFFDAHGDFNTWETTPSGFIGGMPLAMVTGRGEQSIVEGAGLTPLPDEKVVLVDGRDLDPAEAEAISKSNITVTTAEAIVSGDIPGGPLHVHVDMDVVDPIEMPAMNYPAPGGPTLATVAAAVAALHATGRVAAFSVSSWNPTLPRADEAARATQVIAAPFLPQPEE